MTHLEADPTSESRRCVISLGSNVGERLDNLQQATDTLLEAPGIQPVAVSPVYETRPVGPVDQPDYLNAVLVVDTALTARTLLERAQSIENALGRVREEQWGPRTIDVDLVLLDGTKEEAPDLTVPHPRAHERAFVLAPWRDVDEDAEIPGHGRVVDLLAGIGEGGVTRRDDVALRLPG
ncbi:MAG: 2-amino-4-hydroxy-6-hydroxymethyldihydropteridine diphosphokinase [Actinomycetes bacterium]